jgi:hypothetical protein
MKLPLAVIALMAALLSTTAMAQPYEWDVRGGIISEDGASLGPVGKIVNIEFDSLDNASFKVGHSPAELGYITNNQIFTNPNGSQNDIFAFAVAGVQGQIYMQNAKWSQTVPHGDNKGWRKDAVKAPEVEASGSTAALTFLGCCLAVLMGKRRALITPLPRIHA